MLIQSKTVTSETVARLNTYIRNEAKIHEMTDGEPLDQTLGMDAGRFDCLEKFPLTVGELLTFCDFFNQQPSALLIALNWE